MLMVTAERSGEIVEAALILANIAVIAAVLIGLGLTLVGLPGNLLIFLSAAGYGFWDGFVHVDGRFLLLLFGALLLGEAVEFVAGALGAKRKKASLRAMAASTVGGIAGAVMGTAFVPVIGSIAGAVLGAFGASYVAEYSKTGDREQAERVARSVAAGLLLGTLFKLAVGVGMAISVIWRLTWS